MPTLSIPFRSFPTSPDQAYWNFSLLLQAFASQPISLQPNLAYPISLPYPTISDACGSPPRSSKEKSLIQFRLTSATAYTRFPCVQESTPNLNLLVHKCVHVNAPPFLVEMLLSKPAVPSRLRSTARGDLLVPRTLSKVCGPESFSFSGVSLWNSLPYNPRDRSLSIRTFNRTLNSFWLLHTYNLYIICLLL